MFFGLFKNIDSGLNRKISLDSLLSWTFGVILVLIGFGLSFSGLMPSLFLFLIAVLLIPPISSFIEKKIKTKLTSKIKAIIIIICVIAFWTTIDTDNQLTNTVVKNTTPNQQEQIMTVTAMPNTTEEVNQAQYASESEKTEIILPHANLPDTAQNSQLQEKQTKYYTVTKVVDGDTIDVDMDGIVARLRLIGIDTPEIVDPRKTVECFGLEASKKASEILLNKKVRIEADSTQDDRDKYNRLLRYIHREDGLFYNKWIIENGYAHEYTHVVPYKYQAEFQQAENYARENKFGLWHPDACNNQEQSSAPERQTVPPNQPADTPDSQTARVGQANDEVSGYIFYTSRYFTSKFYYCDTDSAWEGLSEKYLESYPSEIALLKVYPTKTLHEPCQ